MKAVFIAFDQAHYEKIVETLDHNNCRGFTSWQQVQGRGSKTGDPHYGTHAWPSMCSAIMVMTEDERAGHLLAALRKLDEESPLLGLRAFSWPIGETI